MCNVSSVMIVSLEPVLFGVCNVALEESKRTTYLKNKEDFYHVLQSYL